MLAKLDDLCRPSQEMSERTQRMVAAHSSGGRYYSHMPSGDQSHHHRRIRHSGRTENHFCNSGACTATRGNADSVGTVPFSRLAFACSSGNIDI